MRAPISIRSDYESGGLEFESLRARHKSNKYLNNLTARKHAMQNKIICMASAWPRGASAIGPGRAVAAAQTLLSIQCVEALYFLPQHWSPLTLRSQGMSSGKQAIIVFVFTPPIIPGSYEIGGDTIMTSRQSGNAIVSPGPLVAVS
jgi:hypothetical protein